MTLESKIQNEIQSALKLQLNLYPHHPPDVIKKGMSKAKSTHPAGWIDIYALGNKVTALIEVKRMTNMPKTKSQWSYFSDISDGQRNTLDYWLWAKGNKHTYIGIGSQYQRPCATKEGKEKKRGIVVIPWGEFVKYEFSINADKFTWDSLSETFARYMMIRSKKTGFIFPESHPIVKIKQRDALYPWGDKRHIVSKRYNK